MPMYHHVNHRQVKTNELQTNNEQVYKRKKFLKQDIETWKHIHEKKKTLASSKTLATLWCCNLVSNS